MKEGEREGAFKPKTLLAYMKRVPVKRVVHLPNVTADPIKFSLLYNLSQGSPLPPGAPSEKLASYTLTGLESVLSRYNTTGKISVHFSTDSSSLLKVSFQIYLQVAMLCRHVIDILLGPVACILVHWAHCTMCSCCQGPRTTLSSGFCCGCSWRRQRV